MAPAIQQVVRRHERQRRLRRKVIRVLAFIGVIVVASLVLSLLMSMDTYSPVIYEPKDQERDRPSARP